MVVELMEDELIPLPEGATLVGLPYTRPIGIHAASGEIRPLPGDVQAVGALLPQGFTRLIHSRLHEDRQDTETAFIRLFSCRLEGRRFLCSGS